MFPFMIKFNTFLCMMYKSYNIPREPNMNNGRVYFIKYMKY